MKIQLERTTYYQSWVEPTLADLVSIENRAERNAKISAELDALNLETFSQYIPKPKHNTEKRQP